MIEQTLESAIEAQESARQYLKEAVIRMEKSYQRYDAARLDHSEAGRYLTEASETMWAIRRELSRKESRE